MGWFVINNEEVTGPLSTESVLSIRSEGKLDINSTYVWGRQVSYWLSYRNWEKSYESILNNSHKRAKAKVQTWYFAENSKAKPTGPFDKETLIEKIKNIETKDDMLIWTKGMAAWASLFEFTDILNTLNISRRKHPRAPIEAQVTLTNERGEAFIGRVDMISPGGCGISKLSGLQTGELYKVEIKSKSLFNPISAVGCIVSQIGNDNYGMRFEKIHVESKSTIISYLKDQGFIKQNQEVA